MHACRRHLGGRSGSAYTCGRTVRAAECPVPALDGNGSHPAFGRIVGHADPAVGHEAGEAVPACQHEVDGLG